MREVGLFEGLKVNCNLESCMTNYKSLKRVKVGPLSIGNFTGNLNAKSRFNKRGEKEGSQFLKRFVVSIFLVKYFLRLDPTISILQ